MKVFSVAGSIASSLVAMTCWAANEPAYFGVTNGGPEQSFVIEIDDPGLIATARAIIKGAQNDGAIHVQGTAIATSVPFNRASPGGSPWAFHMIPNTIKIAARGTHGCSRPTTYVNEHAKADDLNKALFPPSFWCPWNSRIVAEIPLSEIEALSTGAGNGSKRWPWAFRKIK